ncbi:MAG TPA: hypothetical protein VIE39_05635 [Thermoanaerobaculia bacterium]
MTIEVRGPDARTALQAALSAILRHVLGAPHAGAAARSTPIRGEGDDLAALFADLAADFLDQLAQYGGSIYDVAVDGVVRRDDGGYVAWGYAAGSLEASATGGRLLSLESPEAIEKGNIIHLRATLHQSPGHA